ncbi:N-acetyltransferase [Nitratidesulfovibrio sp. 1201_IL3209]|uniref:N-acetyltransferase n=1 Tax=Nitratidesulfovibrio sp. 1201_IL3209 TaxID=3084053 RepID=UPI002FD88613
MHPTHASCVTHLTVEPVADPEIHPYTIDALHNGRVVGRLRGFVLEYHNLEGVAALAGLNHDDLREAVDAVRFAMAVTHDAPISYVDVLLVAPAYRGYGLARQMLERSWLHADCGASLLRPCPLQFCLDWLRPEDLALIGPQCIGVDPKRSLASLIRFYQRIGYAALPGTDFWWRPLPLQR